MRREPVIVYRKKFIRFLEAWCGEDPTTSRVDVIRYFQRPNPASGMYCRAFHTLILDLTRTERELLGGIKKKSRSEIRRASTKDNLVFEQWDGRTPDTLSQFCDFFDNVAMLKGRPKVDRGWLSLIAETASLVLSMVRSATGDPLVWHAYHRVNGRATLLHSASLFRASAGSIERNRLGRANRFHHWQDILRFKSEGESIYDFGGWYDGKKDATKLSINAFKEEFGGVVVTTFICERGITAKGKGFLILRRLMLGNAI